MAWPYCPEPGCGSVVDRVDRAVDTTSAGEVTVYRSYRCTGSGCDWSAWTAEKVVAVRPDSLFLRRKFTPVRPAAKA